MTASAAPGRAATIRLRAASVEPLTRNGLALVLATALTSGLGLVFWFVAARWYSLEQLGIATATIAASGFLAKVSTLGLANSLVRFLPASAADTGRFIRRAYAAAAAAGVTASLAFLALIPVLTPELNYLRTSLFSEGAFVLATVGWVIFVLQDGVMTGLGRATWVPLENGVYAVAKIAILALPMLPSWGIVLAWNVPALVLLVPVNLLIVRRALPTHRNRSATASAGPTLRDVVGYAAGDHTAAMLWLATTEVMTLVVLAKAGEESSALYFLCFSMAYTLYLVTSNIGGAFIVESARRPQDTLVLLHRATKHAARLVVPAVVAGVFLAPHVLGVLGPSYERGGTPLLRLMLISAVPQMFVGAAVHLARARRSVTTVVGIYAAIGSATFPLSFVALDRFGLTGVGWTWVVVQTALAVILLLTVLRQAFLVPLGLSLRHWVSAGHTSVLSRAQRGGARRRVLAALDAAGMSPQRIRLMATENDVVVAAAGLGEQDIIVKVAGSLRASRNLRHHVDVLRTLVETDLEWFDEANAPRVLASGTLDESSYAIESRVAGSAAQASHLGHVARTVQALHHSTMRTEQVDEALFARIVGAPCEVLRSHRHLEAHVEHIDVLEERLRARLYGCTVAVSWVHGDCWLGNALVEDRDDECIVGLIDWEDFRFVGLPDVDLVHLLLTSGPEEIGARVTRALSSGEDLFGQLAAMGTQTDNPHLGADVVAVLAWLHHVALGIERSENRPLRRSWFGRNIAAVLDSEPLGATEPLPVLADPPAPLLYQGGSPWTGAVRGHRQVDDARAHAVLFDSDFEAMRRSVLVDARRWPVRMARPWTTVAFLAVLAAAVGAWMVGATRLDPRGMSDYGLLSILTPWMYAALVVVVGGFLLSLRKPHEEWLTALHAVAYIVMVHGAPIVIYHTLRYEWAWKHTGIVEFVHRTGGVDTTVAISPVYHSWPGFFGASALVTDLLGEPNAVRLAMWAPVYFNVFNLLALRFLFRSITDNHRQIWTAILIFFAVNWVGQDYFSPQAMVFPLYLVLLGIVLRAFRRSKRPGVGLVDDGAWTIPTAALVGLPVAFTIAASHQITPLMMMITCTALFVTRAIRGWFVPMVAIGLVTGWSMTIGRGFVTQEARDAIAALGDPLANSGESLDKAANLSGPQQLVSMGGRLVVVLVALAAVAGLLRLWRARRIDRAVLVLSAAPITLMGATNFGGEVLFRAFLFAAPLLALSAAALVHAGGDRHPGRRVVASFLMVVVFLPGFLLGYYGKEQQFYFSPSEIEAAQWVYENAAPGSLIVEGSRNYPSMSRNYEQFVYVPLSRESTSVQDRILADPAAELERWMSGERYPEAYLLVTRSQQADVNSTGSMARGGLQHIVDALRASTQFRVVLDTGDGVVFALAPPTEIAP